MTISLMLPLVGKTQTDLKRVDKGTGSLTHTRATTATRLNPDTNLIAAVASGELREDGRVYLNYLRYSEQFGNANWPVGENVTVSPNNAVSPDGKATACKIILANGITGGSANYLLQGMITTPPFVLSVFAKAAGLTIFRFQDGVGNGANFNLSTGTASTFGIGGINATIESFVNSWYRCSIALPANAPANPSFYWYFQGELGDGTKGIYLWGAQAEQGATATRYKKSGSSPAYAPKGVLIEGQRTNLLTYSRDMTNAAWTKTAMTAALDQAGEDGAGNSASSLLATGPNATCLQALTQASNPFSGSISIKRMIGTGTVSITLDGGATWVDVTAFISSLVWYRVLKENQTLVNPSFGIRLTTSGDKVAVDYAGVEQAAFASSRIPTTSAAVTRNADVLTVPVTGNVSGLVGSISAGFDTGGSAGGYYYGVDVGIYSGVIGRHGAADKQFIRDGANTVVGEAWTDSAHKAMASRWDSATGSMAVCRGGGTVYSGTFDNDLNIGANISLGISGATDNPLYGHLKHIRIWNRALNNTEMIAITA